VIPGRVRCRDWATMAVGSAGSRAFAVGAVTVGRITTTGTEDMSSKLSVDDVASPGAPEIGDAVASARALIKVYGTEAAEVRALDGVDVSFGRGRFTKPA